MKKQAKEVKEFKGLQTHPRERRYFSEEFRKARAKEWDDGAYTVKEISRMYQVSEAAVYIWLEKFSLNHQQKGGNAANIIINNLSEKVIELYESKIARLEEEIAFWKSQVQKNEVQKEEV